jgi:hypothetical protein
MVIFQALGPTIFAFSCSWCGVCRTQGYSVQLTHLCTRIVYPAGTTVSLYSCSIFALEAYWQ